MEIIDDLTKAPRFTDVRLAQAFRLKGNPHTYMRVCVGCEGAPVYNCVDLNSGELKFVPDSHFVILLEAAVHIG